MDAANRIDPAADDKTLDKTAGVVFFDLETKRSFQQVGGWHKANRLGLAVGVIHGRTDNSFEVFNQDQGPQLVERLLVAPLVVGFNLLRFDYVVLEPYGGKALADTPTLDMMLELQRQLGHRVSLGSVARATLGEAKTADGLQSLKWYRDGKIDKVIEYCKADVLLTKRVFEYGLEHGSVYFEDRQGTRRSVAVPWARDKYRGLYLGG